MYVNPLIIHKKNPKYLILVTNLVKKPLRLTSGSKVSINAFTSKEKYEETINAIPHAKVNPNNDRRHAFKNLCIKGPFFSRYRNNGMIRLLLTFFSASNRKFHRFASKSIFSPNFVSKLNYN